MNKLVLILIILILAYGVYNFTSAQKTISPSPAPIQENVKNVSNNPEIIAENLDTPWALAFLPDKSIIVTERSGKVSVINSNSQIQTVGQIKNVVEEGEGGLMGIAIHPEFSENSFIYFYYTYGGSNGNTLNRVTRMESKNNSLSNETVIVNAIPGASNHNGGRIQFGPDKFLYIATGDAQEPSRSQDKTSLAGKILRVTDDGKPAPDNPFNNEVYSYGHRNPQGIAWDVTGQLWATEHGRSGIQSGLDELNKIKKGGNYGWPESQGDDTKPGTEGAFVHSGSSTWAPAGLTFLNEFLYFGGLRGQTLYKASPNDPSNFQSYFQNEYGRIREVIKGPNNMLYITTSNNDGRGTPKENDDKIIRIDPNSL